MALSKCPECGKEVSDKADKYLHCGCSLENMNFAAEEVTEEMPVVILEITFQKKL